MAQVGDILHMYCAQSTIAKLHITPRLLKVDTCFGTTVHIDLTAASSGHGPAILVENRDQYAESSLPETISSPRPSALSAGRKLRMFPEPGANFIWLDYDDPQYVDETWVDVDKLGSSLRWGRKFTEVYNAWVDKYTTSFMIRLERFGGEMLEAFAMRQETVCWCIDGFLLALALMGIKGVETVEYTTSMVYGEDYGKLALAIPSPASET